MCIRDSACTVWDRDTDSPARVSCPIYRAQDESEAERSFRDMVELVRKTAPAGWTFSEQTSGQNVLMTNFRARGTGTPSIRVNWSRFRTGTNNVSVWVEAAR